MDLGAQNIGSPCSGALSWSASPWCWPWTSGVTRQQSTFRRRSGGASSGSSSRWASVSTLRSPLRAGWTRSSGGRPAAPGRRELEAIAQPVHQEAGGSLRPPLFGGWLALDGDRHRLGRHLVTLAEARTPARKSGAVLSCTADPLVELGRRMPRRLVVQLARAPGSLCTRAIQGADEEQRGESTVLEGGACALAANRRLAFLVCTGPTCSPPGSPARAAFPRLGGDAGVLIYAQLRGHGEARPPRGALDRPQRALRARRPPPCPPPGASCGARQRR